MIELDYKIAEEREENGQIVYQKVRFYEGAITTEDEYDPLLKQTVPVTRYRRTGVIEEVEYIYEQ